MSVESPDMKFARHRLEDLLTTIKERTETSDTSDKEEREDDLYDEDVKESNWTVKTPKRSFGPLTPGKNRDEPSKKRPRGSGKKILFELRQKPFELPSTTDEYSLYKLCRIWLRGKDSSLNYSDLFSSTPQKISNIHSDIESKDLSKEIYKMPTPLNIWDALNRVPSPVPMEHPLQTLDLTSKECILASYMPHWKTVKQRWCKHTRRLERQCYGKNIQILQNMVSATSIVSQYS